MAPRTNRPRLCWGGRNSKMCPNLGSTLGGEIKSLRDELNTLNSELSDASSRIGGAKESSKTSIENVPSSREVLNSAKYRNISVFASSGVGIILQETLQFGGKCCAWRDRNSCWKRSFVIEKLAHLRLVRSHPTWRKSQPIRHTGAS